MMLGELIFQIMSLGRRGSMGFGTSAEDLASDSLPTVKEERVENVDGGIQENVYQGITCAVKGAPGTHHLSPHCGCAFVSS